MYKKIVVACQSCGYLMRDIINAYTATDYSVTLIASKGSWDSMKDDVPANVKFREVIAYDRSSTIKRLLTWSLCALQMFIKILFHHRGEEVLFVSNPPFGSLLPLVLRNRFSLLIWDIYPDVLVSQRVVGRDSFVVKTWANWNRKVFASSEHIFTISDGMKECLANYGSEEKIKVIPLWPNGEMKRIQPEDNKFIREQRLEGKFVVLYSGNMGNTHRVEVILDVAQHVRDENVVFLLIGKGGKKKMIEERIEKEKIENVRILPFQPVEMLPHSLSSASVAVVTLDMTSSQMSVPSKTFNLMAVGVPLMCIAPKESELGKLVDLYKIGKVFTPEDIREMAQYIVHLKADKEAQKRYGDNAMEVAKYFTSENARMFVEV